jgi:hypothetical protein
VKKTESKTDWKRVLAYREGDPIQYEPEVGPYGPNDAAATRAFFAQADLIRQGKVVRRGKRGPQNRPPQVRRPGVADADR